MSLIPLGFWGGTQSFIPIADAPSYGWSFWKRNPNYTGPCIRVFRNSDNTSQDFGFASNNFLDIAAVKSFVGPTGNGWVMRFYDQYGGINLTDEVYPVSSQGGTYIPIIISAGQVITFLNGEPTMQFGNRLLFGGSGTTMAANTNSTFIWSEENSSAVANLVAGNNNGNSIFATGDQSGASGTNVFYDVGNYENYYVNESLEVLGGNNNQQISSSSELHEVKSYRVAQEGARLMGIRGIGYNSLGTGFSIGARGNGTLTTSFQGKLNEMFIYNGSTLTDQKVRDVQSVLNISHNFYDTDLVTYKLILWYDAGNTSSYPGSGTTITDLSVGGVNATLNNGTAYSSADGGKFVLDGVNDWINTSGTTSFPWNVRASDFTIEVWVKFSNANHSARIFGTRNNSTGGQFFLIGGTIDVNGNVVASKKLSFAVSNSDTTRTKWYATTNDILDGNWKHIIATRSDNTYKIYVNGVDQSLTLVNSVGGANPSYALTSSTWRVGDDGAGTGGNGAFDISIMRLYRCALTQAQVTRNYNLEKSRYGL